MRLQIFLLNVENKAKTIEFANKMLAIDNNITIENFIADKKKTKRYKNTNLSKVINN